MPVGLKKIISTRRGTKGQEIEAKSYYYESNMKPIGIIYGCFSPFTGKNGHGRLLEAGKKAGINDFIICIPNKNDNFNEERNMFSNQQKCDIATKAAKELGYNIIESFVKRQISEPYHTLKGFAERYPENRIVLICGPDREEDYGQVCIPFKKTNSESLDDGTGELCPFEYIVLKDRGTLEVSGTKVRETIRNNDEKTFRKLTEYSHEMWEYIVRAYQANKQRAERIAKDNENPLSGGVTVDANKGIMHLYAPGNAKEVDPDSFCKIVEELQRVNGKLVNNKNIKVTEKADGSPFYFGLDDSGRFFTLRGHRGDPVFSAEDIIEGTKKKNDGKVSIYAMALAKLFRKLELNKKLQDALQKAYKLNGSIKVKVELLLVEGALKQDGKIRFVGTTYDEDKIGKFATIVVLHATTIMDANIEKLQDTLKEISACSTNDIKFDTVDVDNIPDINLSKIVPQLVAGIKKIKNKLAEDGLDIDSVMANKSRDKVAQGNKKFVKTHFEELQKILNDAFNEQLKDVKGKWGDEMEGRVFQFANGIMVKITSDNFKQFMADRNDDWEQNRRSSYVEDPDGVLAGVKEHFKNRLNNFRLDEKKTTSNFKQYLVSQTNPIINEAFKGDAILLYTTSKDETFEDFFNSRSLRFANNAGNMYGLGIYTTLEAPKDSKVGYSDKTRTALYGNNVYELAARGDKFFYFLYDWFVKSPLYKKLGSNENTFIKDQFEYFGIDMPSDEELEQLTPSAEVSCGQCAFNFYKYMNQLYYQRKDGTLDCPITGFIYFGRNDGLVGVVWAPYRCKLTRKSINGGDWEPVESADEDAAEANDYKERIFDGNMTDEKVKVYKLLTGYKGEHSPLGQFTDIVIHDNGLIDATYKSNVPQADGYRHCYMIKPNKYIIAIHKLGYRFGTLNGWVKLGVSTQGSDEPLYLPSTAPKEMLPKVVTEGIYLTGMEDVNDKEIKACSKINSQNDTLFIRKSYISTSDLHYGNVVLRDCWIKDDIFDEVVDQCVCEDKDGNLCVMKESEYLAKKKAKEEAKAAKEAEKAEKKEKKELHKQEVAARKLANAEKKAKAEAEKQARKKAREAKKTNKAK